MASWEQPVSWNGAINSQPKMRLSNLLHPGKRKLATPPMLASGPLFLRAADSTGFFFSSPLFLVGGGGEGCFEHSQPRNKVPAFFKFTPPPQQGTNLSCFSPLQTQRLLCSRPSTSLSSCHPFPRTRPTASISAGSNTANCCRRSQALLPRTWPNGAWKR